MENLASLIKRKFAKGIIRTNGWLLFLSAVVPGGFIILSLILLYKILRKYLKLKDK
jgi:hypothetical protein